MLRPLTVLLAATLLFGTANAQFASFTPFGTTCNAPALRVTGLPKLGTTFTVHGISFPSLCTRKFCGCNVGPCNDCQGAVLFFGLGRLNAPLPGGCPLLVTPDLYFVANFPGDIKFPVPNNPALINQKFHLQRLDLAIKEYINTSCASYYLPQAFRGTSDGLTGNIGL